MVASDESDTVGIANFECEEEEERFHGEEAAIDEVAKKEVVGVGTLTSYLCAHPRTEQVERHQYAVGSPERRRGLAVAVAV